MKPVAGALRSPDDDAHACCHGTRCAAAELVLLAALAMVATPSVRALVPEIAQPLSVSEDPVRG
ncbi:hypothetical protein [Streptomyces sp. AK08-02]|uniref:hypothetical protein n=1 Tax=Streptomyces sp. AK08-02 TaxID=3028654 RepID=UPI0029B3C719|nr:hypothetical protein [Streptomyces sp. AK08-02]MDX3752431.1 hypothetical protein [Streptomyces sp. AK08-02]